MTVSLLMNPDTLTLDDFIEQDQVVDPETGKKHSALTLFDFDFPPVKPVKVDGKLAFPDMTLMISPDCAIMKGSVALTDKKKGEALLSHEQLHYDVAHVIGRVLVKHLTDLRANSAAELDAAADVLFNRHFTVRGKLINRRYDLETDHGLNSHFQKHWKKVMGETLKNPKATQMAGYWL
jgi:hypothetical protein